MRRVAIWDLPTRVFHWSLAVLAVLALVVGDDDQGVAFTLHAYAGYAILLLLGFRLPWGWSAAPGPGSPISSSPGARCWPTPSPWC